MLLIIPKDAAFAEILCFSNNFGFYVGKLGPKIDQNCKLQLRSICTKIQNFEGFSKHYVFIIGDYLWSKFQQDQTIFGEIRVHKIPIPWTLNQDKILWKI